MREAIGGTWIFQIVIVFILLFTGFMCLSVNRSRAFSVKDKIVQTIQAHNGVTEDTLNDIVSYITNNSYRNTGDSPNNYKEENRYVYTCYDRNGTPNSKAPVFCIAPVDVSDVMESEFNELPAMVYYHVMVFYNLDLPVFHDLFNFRVVGDTKIIYGGVS